MFRIIFLSFIITIFPVSAFPVTSSVLETQCSIDEAIQAEIEVNNLQEAKSLYSFYTRFSHCDDGAIAEGYSHSIVQILTQKWGSQIEKINHLTSSDKKFRYFFLKHIDELMSSEERKIIIDKAQKKCPENSNLICKQLVLKLESISPEK